MTKDELRKFMARQKAYRNKQALLYYGGKGNTTLHKSQVRRATRLLIMAAMADCLLTMAEAAQLCLNTEEYRNPQKVAVLLENLSTMGGVFANLTDKEVYPLD